MEIEQSTTQGDDVDRYTGVIPGSFVVGYQLEVDSGDIATRSCLFDATIAGEKCRR